MRNADYTIMIKEKKYSQEVILLFFSDSIGKIEMLRIRNEVTNIKNSEKTRQENE